MNPTEIIHHRKERSLEVTFSDGSNFIISAELLRVLSPSAENRGHGNKEGKFLPGKRYVGINELEPVGNYAIRIKFDDLHSTGIYTWKYLNEIGKNQKELMDSYIKDLSEKGLSRDP